MQDKTIDGLLAEIEELKAWKQAAIAELIRWNTWGENLLVSHGCAVVGDSIHSKTVELVNSLDSRVSSLREGLEDIRSLRRIGHVSDVATECDFYLNRDDEEA